MRPEVEASSGPPACRRGPSGMLTNGEFGGVDGGVARGVLAGLSPWSEVPGVPAQQFFPPYISTTHTTVLLPVLM